MSARVFAARMAAFVCLTFVIRTSAPLWAAPPLTTIQDMLYKADGAPYNGFLLVEWKSFEAADASTIATHSVTAPIINGVVRVQLVPTTNGTPGASYRVRYNSDGKVQFEETWSVPPSATPLKLSAVRVGGVGGVSEPPPGPITEIHESDVIGLVDDLAIRPVKGPGYAPSRAIFASSSGALEAVVGNLADCVRVDGTAGPCGSEGATGPAFVDGETPAGLMNGSNAVFTLADAPAPVSSLALYRNGLRLQPDVDFTIDGNAITFLGGAIPQLGDILTANYRLADASNPLGMAGGALTGTFPNPSLALGIVADANISDLAGIRESKLALNYATHTNVNDPTAEQRAALTGTAGAPAASNRYVTDQDPRMTNLRSPVAHGLLSPSHGDAVTAQPARGDVIVAQGSAPTAWTRLPIGPANHCLTSNGFDAVWNACLFTGFTTGSIPFVDASGNLAQNNSRLIWDNLNRKLSIGNNVGATTMYVYDSTPGTGATTLTVRAGDGQGTDAIQRWLTAGGVELARVDADGKVAAQYLRGASSASAAAWSDAGSSSDPAQRADGDAWYNTSAQARKTMEGGQTHSTPQVICSSTGLGTSSTAPTRLGSCTIAANLLKAGDRVEIKFDYFHAGAGTAFSVELRWAGTTLLSRDASAAETLVTGRAESGIYGSGAQWSAQTWGTTLSLAATAGTAADPVSSPIVLDFLGRMAGSTAETVALRNFTVVRYPAQSNP